MTEQKTQRICPVGLCHEDYCPHRGVYEEKGWDESGLHPKYPYCYEAEREIPDVIGTKGYKPFPDWCPLETRNIHTEEAEKVTETKEMPVVHLWQPLMWHCDQNIVGNKEGLELLKEAIQKAIDNEKGVAEVFISDGEGHDIIIQCVKETELLAVPYTDEVAKEHQERAIYPWGAVSHESK
jgi:hypothetical protein